MVKGLLETGQGETIEKLRELWKEKLEPLFRAVCEDTREVGREWRQALTALEDMDCHQVRASGGP